MIADEQPSVVSPRSKSSFPFAHIELFIHPLKRPAVRELARRWLEPSNLYSADTFHTVLKRMDTSHLPATAYVVSMIAWALEKNVVGTINHASLLERFVEGILNKANLKEEVSRSATDYVIKDTFLAELAHLMVVDDSYVIDKNDLVTFTISFIQTRSWKYDGAAFVEDLIRTGVLLCVGTSVVFRYRCLREYFLARYMMSNEAYRTEVLAKDNYLRFEREIDLYTGLRRHDRDILKALIGYTDELVF